MSEKLGDLSAITSFYSNTSSEDILEFHAMDQCPPSNWKKQEPRGP